MDGYVDVFDTVLSDVLAEVSYCNLDWQKWHATTAVDKQISHVYSKVARTH